METNQDVYKERTQRLESLLNDMCDARFGNWLRSNFIGNFPISSSAAFEVQHYASEKPLSYEYSSYGHVVVDNIIRRFNVPRVKDTEVVVDVGPAPVDLLSATVKFAMALGEHIKTAHPQPQPFDPNSRQHMMMVNQQWIDWYRSQHYSDLQVAWTECAKLVYRHHNSTAPDDVLLMPDPHNHRVIIVFPKLTDSSYRP